MTELVINAPHLQSHSQRLGAVTLSVVGWLLWCYFFFPLVTLGCWLVDDDICSQWVNMSGGYLNLLEMLALYGNIIVGMILGWSLWVLYNRFRRRRVPISSLSHPVSRVDLCRAFGVDEQELKPCQESRYAVVHFDQQACIIGLESRLGRSAPLYHRVERTPEAGENALLFPQDLVARPCQLFESASLQAHGQMVESLLID